MISISLDTNILIYNHYSINKNYQDIANDLLLLHPVVSTQVISEYLNVMKRLYLMPKANLLNFCAQWTSQCNIHPVDTSTVKLAEHLILRYDFQIFDSIIIASAIEAGCEVLYSEDMQHNMKVEGLSIINPFL
jgi:predicted nucleic acid-binding protein